MWAVALVLVIFFLAQVGLQGIVSPSKLQNNSTSAITYVASVMGGSGWGKVMALALALSVIAATGTGIVLSARILYGMAGHRVLPAFLGNVSPKYKTPVIASVVCGVFLIAITWVYLLATSVQNAFNDVLDVSAILYAAFYVLTAAAAMVYYRRRIMSSAMNLVTLGILPLAAVVFLVWMGVRNLQLNLSDASRWSLVAVVGVGLVLMLIARYGLRSPFFSIPRESDASENS
jgi:amino acid transporter